MEEELDVQALRKSLRKTQEKIQNDFINRIYDDVQFLGEKADRESYEPTAHERETVAKIAEIINSIKW